MTKHQDDNHHHHHHDNVDNTPLRAALLRGALAIRVVDTDIRRDDGCAPDDSASLAYNPTGGAPTVAGAGAGGGGGGGILPGLDGLVSKLLPIETDYILRVSPSRSTRDADGGGNESQNRHRDLEAFRCSKRYVDLRNLAVELRGHSVAILRYYEAIRADADGAGSKRHFFKTAGGAAHRSSGSGSGSSTKALLKGVFFAKPMEYVTYLAAYSNSSSSNVAQELDAVFQHQQQQPQQQQQQHRNKQKHTRGESGGSRHVTEDKRTSILLHQGAPMFVRTVMEGVDEFYEGIFSEKRQFMHKVRCPVAVRLAFGAPLVFRIARRCN